MDYLFRVENERRYMVGIGRLEWENEQLRFHNFEKDQSICELNNRISMLTKGKDKSVEEKIKIQEKYEKRLRLLKQDIKAFKDQKTEDAEVIHNLNKRLDELGNEIQEKDRVLEMYAKVQGFKGDTEHLEKEIEVLKRQKFEEDQTISELHEILGKINDEILVKDMILGNYEEKLGLSKCEGQVLKERKVEEVVIIHELNKKLSKLKDEILALVTYENEAGLLKQNIQVLMSEKVTDNQMIDEMKCTLLAADKTIGEMTCELSKACYERNKFISESNEKMGRLENQMLENVDKLEREIRDLKDKILAADHMIENMKSEQSKADDGVNKIISEWKEKTSTLENQLLEKDETIRNYQKKLKYYVEKGEQVKREAQILKGQILRDDEMRSEHAKGADEKNKIVAEFSEEMRKLKNKLQEKDQAVGMYKAKIGQLEWEVEELKGEKFTVCQMIEKMKCDELKANHKREKIISALGKRIGMLENQTLEKDQVAEMYQKQLKCSDAKVELLEMEIQGLKDQIISADRMIEKMKSKQVAVDQIMGKVKHGQSKAHNAVEVLVRRNSEASKIVDGLMSQALVPTNEAGNCDIKIALSTMPKVLSTWTSTKRSRNYLQKKGNKVEQQEISEKSLQAGLLSGNSVQAERGCLERENNCKRLKSTDPIEVIGNKKLGEEQKICENSDDEACDESSINDLLAKLQMFKSK